MTYAFTFELISPSSPNSPSPPTIKFQAWVQIPALSPQPQNPDLSRQKSTTRGTYLRFDAQIPALRPKSQPKFQSQGPNPSFESQIPASCPKLQPQRSNLSIGAEIPASRLKSQPSCLNQAKEFPTWFFMIKRIGHGSLWSRYPSHYRITAYTNLGASGTADQLKMRPLKFCCI